MCPDVSLYRTLLVYSRARRFLVSQKHGNKTISFEILSKMLSCSMLKEHNKPRSLRCNFAKVLTDKQQKEKPKTIYNIISFLGCIIFTDAKKI